MNLGQSTNGESHRASSRLVWVSLMVIGAIAALTAVSHMAQAQPMSSSGVASPDAPFTDVGTESFEGVNVLNYWTLDASPPQAGYNPRWNLMLSTTQPYGKAYDGTHAMWFGDPATGDYGGVGCDACPIFTGTLTYSGTIPIPNDTYAFMSFASWERTEMSIPTLECYNLPTCRFDARRVYISSTLNPTWQLKWSTDRDPTIENQWHTVVVDISEFRGQDIQIRFEFDTVDGRNNDARGWYVD